MIVTFCCRHSVKIRGFVNTEAAGIAQQLQRLGLQGGESRNSGWVSHRGKRFVSFSKSVQNVSGSTQPPIQWVLGPLFAGDKAAGV
jgi:hypothetical protein